MILAITGVSGSLGQAILRQQGLLKELSITKIIGLSRDEQKQVSLQRSYKGDIPLRLYLADVTDKERMQFALKEAAYVIHAAAQKHIDKFELDVKTGYRTNIIGTQNVADAFMESRQAKSGVLVSTDKAALPITSYGVSKLAAEHLWRWHNAHQSRVDLGVVRYGNVLGSRGSVIEQWTKLAQEGKPLPITSLECTRFFMEVDEAAQFVIRSLHSHFRGVNIPSMKSAYMSDVARVIWKHWQKNDNCPLEVIGTRGVEKLHEILDVERESSLDAEKWNITDLERVYERWLKSA